MGARETALNALMACRKSGAWSNGVLKEYIQRDRLDSRDAALATRLCYGVLQNRQKLDFYLQQLLRGRLKDLHPVVRDILHLGLYQIYELDKIPDSAAVNESVTLAKKYNKKVFSVVGNMSIALERRDFMKSIDCFVCNIQEVGLLFFDDYSEKTVPEMVEILSSKVQAAQIPSMIVTMGGDGAVYADKNGDKGWCPARKVEVKDTTGAGDSFCAGVSIGLTYGKSLREACEIGSMLAASVIVTTDSVCPRFLPRELGLDIDVEE